MPDCVVTYQPASWLGFGPRAPKLIGGYFDTDGNVVLENGDHSMLNPIVIPEGWLVFVDQGDGGWLVG